MLTVEEIRIAQAQYLLGFSQASCPQAKREPGGPLMSFYLEGFDDGTSNQRRGLEDRFAMHVGQIDRLPHEKDTDYEDRVRETEENREDQRRMLFFLRVSVARTPGDASAVVRAVAEEAGRLVELPSSLVAFPPSPLQQ